MLIVSGMEEGTMVIESVVTLSVWSSAHGECEITAPVAITVNRWNEAQGVFVGRPTVNTTGWDVESSRAAVRLAVEDGRIKVDGVA